MAKVTAEKLPIPRVDVPVIRLTLELTQIEAEALVHIAGRVGGFNDGPRGIFSGKENSILYVLDAAGIKDTKNLQERFNAVWNGTGAGGGSLYFNLK